MEALLISTALVTLAEMGDKTQLLSLLLAAKFKKPWTIVAAILVATLLNHALAAWLGHWLTGLIPPEAMRWILGLSFLAMAGWMLIPDQLDEDEQGLLRWQRFGVFGLTFILFFLAEMGDKTQIATVGLAARFEQLPMVIAGTTLGMMLANVPAVLIGDRMAGRLPIQWIHRVAALIFALLGVLALWPQLWSA